MSNTLLLSLIKTLAGWLVGSELFRATLGAVERWADAGLSGAEKKSGVIAELQSIGYVFSKRAANLAVELALAYLDKKST